MVMTVETNKRIRVLLADDHELFRESIKKLLECDPTITVVGQAANGADAFKLARDLRPDILFLDLLMPVMAGLPALRELATLTPPVRTVLLTADVGDADIAGALQLGARGVLLKQSTPEMMFRCIRAVLEGQYWIGRECVGDLITRLRAQGSPSDPAPKRPTFGLTPRQLDIVSAIVDGATNADIAKQFSISATTVKYHLTHMFEKIGVSNRVELALFAVEHHLNRALSPH